MKFSSGDFKNAIKSLYKEKKVNFIDVKGSKKINDDSILYLDGKN
jgi:predicted RNA-binding protein (virulence factor B family)